MVRWLSKTEGSEAKIKEELFPIAWHPDCVMDWCMQEDEKRLWKYQTVISKNYLIRNDHKI